MIMSGKTPSEMKDIIRQQSRDQKMRVDGMRVIIYDVPNTRKLNTDGILADIHEYTTNSIMTLEELKKSTRIVSRPVTEDTEMGNLIMECTPRVYTKILAARKVYLEHCGTTMCEKATSFQLVGNAWHLDIN